MICYTNILYCYSIKALCCLNTAALFRRKKTILIFHIVACKKFLSVLRKILFVSCQSESFFIEFFNR